jgi:Spy/CpxP family protein refolding chaperone
MKRALLPLACLLVLTAGFVGSSAQAGDGSAGTSAGTSAGDGKGSRMSPEIKADIEALRAARKHMKDDRENHDVDRLTADREAVKAAFKKLREDISALRKDRKADA